jgi:hypothetical protein
MAQLFVLSGADVGRSFELKAGARIGRSPECEIVLKDPSVSRKHAHAERRGEAWWLVDDGSRNGITVERVRVPRLELHDGQEFQVGELLVRFRASSAEPVASAAPPAPPVAPPAPPQPRAEPARPRTRADEIVLEGADGEIELTPRELGRTTLARQPAEAASKAAGALRDTGFGARPAGAPLDARKTAAGARVLQYHRIEDRGGLASADLTQLPAWLKTALVALAVVLAGAVAYLAFAGTATLKERVLPSGGTADADETVER